MEIYLLEDENIISENFDYAYSLHSKNVRKFRQKENYIANFETAKPEEYSYTSIITKKQLDAGVTVSAKCSFGKFGAPLIVITDDITDGNDGMKLFGLHFEVVAYEKGINVWRIVPAPEKIERPIATTLLGTEVFEILPDEMINISVKINLGEFLINVNGHELKVDHADIPKRFFVGITGCEGPDKFYEFKIEE